MISARGQEELASNNESPHHIPTRFGPAGFLSAAWALCAVATAIFFVRLRTHWKFYHRICLDDVFALLATLLLVAYHVILTLAIINSFALEKLDLDISAGLQPISAKVSLVLKLAFTLSFVYSSVIFAAKTSLLLFLQRLTPDTRRIRYARAVIAIVAIFFAIDLVLNFLSCSGFTRGDCDDYRTSSLSSVKLKLSTSGDVLTTILIVLIPLSLAPRFRIPTYLWVAFIGVILFTLVAAALAIIRLFFATWVQPSTGMSVLVLFFEALEAMATCIICNSAPFGLIFPRTRQNRVMSDETHSIYSESIIYHPTHSKLFARNPNTIQSDEDLLERMRIEMSNVRTSVSAVSHDQRTSWYGSQQSQGGIRVSTVVNQNSRVMSPAAESRRSEFIRPRTGSFEHNASQRIVSLPATALRGNPKW